MDTIRKPNARWERPRRVWLTGDEVHVWRAPLDVSPPTRKKLEQTLAADERARAQRFLRPIDRGRFVVGRGVLRTILGQYLCREPAALRICYNRYGKPALAEQPGDDTASLTFSVSHSQGLALYAVARGRSVGIDLEYMDAQIAHEQIAEHLFSAHELDMLHVLPAQLQRDAVFVCWTRKEAYLKARGIGLSLAPDHCEMSVDPRLPAALLSTGEQSQDLASWRLQDLTLRDAGYVAALAVRGEQYQLRCWQSVLPSAAPESGLA